MIITQIVRKLKHRKGIINFIGTTNVIILQTDWKLRHYKRNVIFCLYSPISNNIKTDDFFRIFRKLLGAQGSPSSGS